MSITSKVNAIGNYIASVSPETWAVNPQTGQKIASYPVPDLFVGIPGAPALIVRWDGGLDDGQGLPDEPCPPILSYEVRIYHPMYGSQDAPDGYVQAQEQVLRGIDAMLTALKGEDRSMGGLVLDTQIASIVTGELIDSDNNLYYGCELIVNCEVH